MSELYQIGTFVQIHELQDMGDKLRMIVMAHRRIAMTAVLTDDPLEEEEKLAKTGKGQLFSAFTQVCHCLLPYGILFKRV